MSSRAPSDSAAGDLCLERDLPTTPADVAAQRGLREARAEDGLDEDRLRRLVPPRLVGAAVADRSTSAGRPPFDLQTVEPRLRPVAPADRDFLLRLYASTREEELRQVDWPPEQKAAFLEQQFAAQDLHYRERYPGASLDVVEIGGAAAGRFYVARWEREIRVMDVALLPEFRGRGIGTRLLRRLFEEADRSARAVSIHVESMNPARELYRRLGFALREDKGVYLLLERPAAETGGR
jgi:ribosomal protein S18 acetylase RimI-like enzyme